MTQSVGLRENSQPTVVTPFSVVGGINMTEDINRYPIVQSWLRNVTGKSAKVYMRYFSLAESRASFHFEILIYREDGKVVS